MSLASGTTHPYHRCAVSRVLEPRVHEQSGDSFAVDAWGHFGPLPDSVATCIEATRRMYQYTGCAADINDTQNDRYTLIGVIYGVGVCGGCHCFVAIRASLVIVIHASVVSFATQRGHLYLLRAPLLFVSAYWPSSFSVRILTPWKFRSTAR